MYDMRNEFYSKTAKVLGLQIDDVSEIASYLLFKLKLMKWGANEKVVCNEALAKKYGIERCKAIEIEFDHRISVLPNEHVAKLMLQI